MRGKRRTTTSEMSLLCPCDDVRTKSGSLGNSFRPLCGIYELMTNKEPAISCRLSLGRLYLEYLLNFSTTSRERGNAVVEVEEEKEEKQKFWRQRNKEPAHRQQRMRLGVVKESREDLKLLPTWPGWRRRG